MRRKKENGRIKQTPNDQLSKLTGSLSKTKRAEGMEGMAWLLFSHVATHVFGFGLFDVDNPLIWMFLHQAQLQNFHYKKNSTLGS